jgi:CubicO group peptidase (beta-lactamase class C family)/beta-glucosidase-like glycosyl hydrolase
MRAVRARRGKRRTSRAICAPSPIRGAFRTDGTARDEAAPPRCCTSRVPCAPVRFLLPRPASFVLVLLTPGAPEPLHAVRLLRRALPLLAAAALAACREEPSPWAEERIARMPLREQVAQMVAPAVYVGADARPAQDSVLARRLAASAAGGVRLLPGSAEVAARRVALLQRMARRPLLVIADLDRGAGGALAGAAELPPPAWLGAWETGRVAAAAERVADEARAAGVNFAMLSAPSFPYAAALPVAAGPRADSAFAAYAQGLAEHGMIVGVRALSPGPEAADTDYRVIGWDRAAAEALQLDLLEDLLARGVGAVKPASVAVPSLTRDSVPLPDNPVFVSGVLRRDLAFEGLVVEDLASAAPLVRRYGGGEAAVRAVAAGADLLVGVDDERVAIDAIVAAVESGRVPRSRIDASVRRIFAAKEGLGLGASGDADSARSASSARGGSSASASGGSASGGSASGGSASIEARSASGGSAANESGPGASSSTGSARSSSTESPSTESGSTSTGSRAGGSADRGDTLAVAAHRAAVSVLGAAPAEVLRGCRRTVLVTRQGVAAPALVAALRRAVPELAHLQTDRIPRRGPLVPAGVAFDAADAPCVVAVAFPGARPEVVNRVVPALAWPDSAALDTLPAARRTALQRDTTARRLIWIDFFPGLGTAPPAARTVVVARGTSAQAQQAAAAAVTGQIAPRLPAGAAWPAARTLRIASADSVAMNGDTVDAIDGVIRQAIADGVFSAAAVAVGRRGALVKLRGYGQTNGAPVDPRATMFDIASLSKVVGTTPAAMVMMDDGRMELGAPLRRYVPQFRGESKGDVTIRSLLTHTAGLPPGDYLFPLASADAALRRVIRADLETKPGVRPVYSDYGMILLAEAIRRRADEPIDRLLARRVFGPLGMTGTMYLPGPEQQPRIVPTAAAGSERPYTVDGVVHDGNAYRLGGVAGHAGLFSTAWDLSVYSQMLLNGGAYGTRRVLQAGTVAAWTRRQPNAGTRALGWDTPAPRSSAGSYFSERSFGHTGFTGTSIWIDPQRELFVVLLTNRTYRNGDQGRILQVRARVADLAAKSITDQPVRPRAGSPAAIAEAERAAAAARARARARRRPAPRRNRPRAEIETTLPTVARLDPSRPGSWMPLAGAEGWTIGMG